MGLTAVIYDLDGTLVDSRDDLADSVNAMLSLLGLPERPPQVIYGFIGEGAERLIRRSLGPAHEELYPRAAPVWREEYSTRLLAKTRARRAPATLLAARRFPRGGDAGRRQRGRSGDRQGGGRPRLRRHLGHRGTCGAGFRRLSLLRTI